MQGARLAVAFIRQLRVQIRAIDWTRMPNSPNADFSAIDNAFNHTVRSMRRWTPTVPKDFRFYYYNCIKDTRKWRDSVVEKTAVAGMIRTFDS